MDETANQIASELQRLEESATYSAQGQFEQAKYWRGLNVVLGVPTSALAAISGGTGLAGVAGRVPAAVLALIAAGLGAVLTTVNASRRTTQAHAAATTYLGIQADCRQLRMIDLPGLASDEARSQLSDLTSRWKEANTTSEIPSFYAYWRGKKNLKKGRQRYEVDR